MNNAKFKQLPLQIKKKVNKKIICRLAVFLALELLLTIVIVKWGSVIFNVPQEYNSIKYSCYVIVLILPIFITKIYKIFTDANYAGVVKEVKIQTVVDSKSSFKPTTASLYRKNEIYLTIQITDGKTVTKKVNEVPSRSAKNLDEYKEGDKVLHLHGTGITVVLPCVKDTHCCCVICGDVNDVADEFCRNREVPLVKSID